MNDDEFGSSNFLKLQYKWGDQIIQLFWRIAPCHEIRSPLFNLRKFRKAQKSTTESCRKHENRMNDKEFGSSKLLKLKYRRADQIIQLFCRIGSPWEIRSPFFNLMSFKKAEQSTAESSRMHWNLMNDDEFGSLNFLKLQYKWGDQIIQLFWRIASSYEIRSTLFNLWKFQKAEKNTVESCRRH